jgi:epoxyqueuosine reductase QueG
MAWRLGAARITEGAHLRSAASGGALARQSIAAAAAAARRAHMGVAASSPSRIARRRELRQAAQLRLGAMALTNRRHQHRRMAKSGRASASTLVSAPRAYVFEKPESYAESGRNNRRLITHAGRRRRRAGWRRGGWLLKRS